MLRLQRIGWVRRLARWWGLRRRKRPAWVTDVRLRGSRRTRTVDVEFTLRARWWATDEDKAAAKARLVRRVATHLRGKYGFPRVRLAGPFQLLWEEG